jgi:hypothetical protein
MPHAINHTAVLDLSNKGSYEDVDVSRVNEISAAGLDNANWGSAVIEVAKLYGGQSVSFSTAATIDTSTNTKREGLDVSAGVNTVRVSVTTADSSAGHGRVLLTGKETQ